RLIGSLIYAMFITRLDITYSVSFTSCYLYNLIEYLLKQGKGILKYLKGTINYNITYKG
ncbi:hypothetical protein LX36DRAFT_551289, partial [Colletotrichum falcatum]